MRPLPSFNFQSQNHYAFCLLSGSTVTPTLNFGESMGSFIGIGWCSIHASFPTSTSFRVISFLSLRRTVYFLILDFSAETIWDLLSQLWTFGARFAFLFFCAYRGMLLWWGSSTFIWTEERIRMHTFLSFMLRIACASNIVETLTFN